MKIALLLLLLGFASTGRAASPFDEAENGAMSRDQRRVRDLYAKAAESDPDVHRRDQARIRAARIEWYILHDPAAARGGLAKVAATSREASAALAERSRLECELVHDFDAARKAAQLAYAAASTQADRDEALTRAAAATLEEARSQRDRGKCPDRPALSESIAGLRQAIAGSGPTVERTLMLLDAGLLAHDDVAVLSAWRSYYADLPALVPSSVDDRKAVGLALASARLFAEAELVLRDPCLATPIATDAVVQDILAYSASMRRLTALAAGYHRGIAAGTSDTKAFTRALGDEAASLWRAFSWKGEPPPFSLEAAQRELSKRFGAVVTLGETEGISNLVYGHRVAEEKRTVEQYGRRGTLQFVQLDGMISGGYATWVTHGQSGTGGWVGSDAVSTVYQIRPMYLDNPLRLWHRMSDPGERARRDDETRRETALDRERAAKSAVVALPGLALRLRQQYAEALRQRLESEGLQGEALRDAFLRTAAADKLASSIWAHEGRHSIDKALAISNSVELEFRAKLSEVVFAPAPRAAMGSILAPVGGSGAHAAANERVLRGIVGWMRAHAAEIAGFDAAAPTLPQLDRLTDDQLRAAFRSLDPLRTQPGASPSATAAPPELLLELLLLPSWRTFPIRRGRSAATRRRRSASPAGHCTPRDARPTRRRRVGGQMPRILSSFAVG